MRKLSQKLKREEIHASTYGDFEVLRERIEEFIEGYYNVASATLGARLSFAPRLSKKESPTENPRDTSTVAMMTFFEGANAGQSTSAMDPSKQWCDTHLYLSEGFIFKRFLTGSQLCTNCARIQRFHTARG